MHARKVIVDGARLLERVQMARCRDRRRTRRMLIARLGRRLLPVLVLLVAMSAVAFAAASDPEPYLRPQRLVDVGGHRLNIYCTGSGAPTVILEAGHGSSMIVWRDVQAVIAQHTRTCAYDRAGMGFSDGAPPPRDATAVVTDLHALLRAGECRRSCRRLVRRTPAATKRMSPTASY